MASRMSRYTGRTYGRKQHQHHQQPPVGTSSLQFDALLSDKKKPTTASKTAGTLGKWGNISCTSIRSAKLNGRNGDPLDEVEIPSPSKDPFLFQSSSPDVMSKKQAPTKRKFFKSRVGNVQADINSLAEKASNECPIKKTKAEAVEEPAAKEDDGDVRWNCRPSRTSPLRIVMKKFFDSPANIPPPLNDEHVENSGLKTDSEIVPSSMPSVSSLLSSPMETVDISSSPESDHASATQDEGVTEQVTCVDTLDIKQDAEAVFHKRTSVITRSGAVARQKTVIKAEVDLSSDLDASSDKITVTDSTQGSSVADSVKSESPLVRELKKVSSLSQTPEMPSSQSSGISSQSSDEAKDKDMPNTRAKKIFSGNNKPKRSLYKHKWHDDALAKPNPLASGAQSKVKTEEKSGSFDFDDIVQPAKLTKVSTWPTHNRITPFGATSEPEVTKVRCPKEAKGFYTVVKNVQKAHQIQESGEFQEFNDDVEYILDALKDTNSISTRCLSAVTLASKCMMPAFRMHVRAHSTVTKFFATLHDAPSDPSLSLCTATVMFVLSQDRLNMDLDRESLNLMLQLADTSDGSTLRHVKCDDKDFEKNKAKVQELCADMQRKGHATHLNLDDLTANQLAMETLLSLTSRRAGEWFKEELRELNGLDHIIGTLAECTEYLLGRRESLLSKGQGSWSAWTSEVMEKLHKADRCLQVLENVTYQNEDNQRYLLQHQGGLLLKLCLRLFPFFCSTIKVLSASPIVDKTKVDRSTPFGANLEALLTILKTLLHLTHDYSKTSTASRSVAERHPELFKMTLECLVELPKHLPEEKHLFVYILPLVLLTNMVERCLENRDRLAGNDLQMTINGKQISSLKMLCELFCEKEARASEAEASTDNLLDTKEKESKEKALVGKKEEVADLEEFVEDLVHRAGRHMEEAVVAAHTAILLGYCIMDSEERVTEARLMLPKKSFDPVVSVLETYYQFVKLSVMVGAGLSSSCLQGTEEILKFFKGGCKVAAKEESVPLSLPPSTSGTVTLDDTLPLQLDSDDDDQDDFFSMFKSSSR
ncbi:unnamed protein product [Darwinula stevensoni]|uniref:WAPL domain-containing protein n=1 Tax=Darwinula stevensoni TaxID=69355 RepID=A0A7R8X4N8_9CRUS|nr:unnamed protein product [Darwinula stevensoni]CAG0885344.1 unnamed protein product [Darwinula stevensoni]